MVDAQSYVNRGGVLQLEPLVGLAMANGPQCIPDITGEWKQVENQTMIYHSEGKEYSAALKDTAILPCRYGGWIQVVEVYKGNAGSGNEYVNLAIMNNMGWNQIHCGYIVKSTELDSPLTDMTSEITRKHRNINQDDIDKINNLFNQFDVNTQKRICGFFAECSAETSSGARMLEGAGTKQQPFVDVPTRTNINNWFDTYKKYKAKYRGAGVIQLTWDYHYVEFSDWMKNYTIPN